MLRRIGPASGRCHRSFGGDAVRATHTHAKIAMVRRAGGDWLLQGARRTPTTTRVSEQIDISEGAECCAWLEDLMAEMWRELPAVEAEDAPAFRIARAAKARGRGGSAASSTVLAGHEKPRGGKRAGAGQAWALTGRAAARDQSMVIAGMPQEVIANALEHLAWSPSRQHARDILDRAMAVANAKVVEPVSPGGFGPRAGSNHLLVQGAAGVAGDRSHRALPARKAARSSMCIVG